MEINIDQLKMDLCKQLAIISMIEKAALRKRVMVAGNKRYYEVFGSPGEQERDIQRIENIINRLNNYLIELTTKP